MRSQRFLLSFFFYKAPSASGGKKFEEAIRWLKELKSRSNMRAFWWNEMKMLAAWEQKKSALIKFLLVLMWSEKEILINPLRSKNSKSIPFSSEATPLKTKDALAH